MSASASHDPVASGPSTPRRSPPSKDHLAHDIPDNAFPRSFLASGVHCGIKKRGGANDLGLVVSTAEHTSAAACFTKNVFKAAPVLVSQEVLLKFGGRAAAVVVNSGCANAVTGKQGMEDARDMVRTVDALREARTGGTDTADGVAQPVSAGAAPSKTLVMSTGVIGQTLPITNILNGIALAHANLGASFASWQGAAQAFMTTDTFYKLRARTFTLAGKKVRIAGIDKGAGMIHPDMGPPSPSTAPAPPHATLLGLIATDAAVSPSALQSALTFAVERSFNSISVDGDMSTNDTIVALANGASGMERDIDELADPELYTQFRDELTAFATELAKLVVRDGEGATKFVTVSVEGASSFSDAHTIASTISTSSLVKTALYGEDANWGRILAAVGAAPVSNPPDPQKVSVSFLPCDGSTELKLLVNGEPEKVDEVRAKQILQMEDLEIRVVLGEGGESARYYTCDLSHDYVTINGDYRS
ncbi:arginine biosynthesis protein ArgJ [Dacryopinax primogenitus]|uniref:Arginine biosynthesis bifunctional protein ArgJ, mitochondrial n=1 Tax=Dacryopinax primogenitus (strain DJM 731) TaxID=1858805 RepID=M5GBQ1_DACPD|nr:arginine biosynthesis protein ArgJ [Dacryopinax primogenitus]EJU03492.1 arginine biosynthesis protein ArgJ [Dacryopinax primogenitus]